MDARRYHFYGHQVEGWQGQYDQVLRDGSPRLYVEAAVHATLARLRCYATRWELLRVHDMTQAEDLACIRSLLDAAGAAEGLVRAVRAAALYLRWQELDGTPDSPCGPSQH